jgi:hypothetical protein
VFVDGTNDGSGDTGAIGSPFDSMAQLHAASSLGSSRVIFRTGTYTLAGITVSNADDVNGEERIEWAYNGTPAHPVTWMAYPDETVTIDYEYTGSGAPYNTGDSVPRIRISGPAIYMDGLNFTRSMTMAFQLENRVSNHGAGFWRNDFLTTGPGIDGGNSAFIMWVAGSNDSFGDFVVGNSFEGIQGGTGNSGLKMYNTNHALIEGNWFDDTGNHNEATIALKATDVQYTLRNNAGEFTTTGIGGNMNGTVDPQSGEISYNLIRGASGAEPTSAGMTIGRSKINTIGQHDVFRNTFVAEIEISNLVTADGLYTFTHNVIVNDQGAQSPWPFFTESSITDSSRLVRDDNLTGASMDGILDANGELTGDSLTYLGTRGHQIPGAATGLDPC